MAVRLSARAWGRVQGVGYRYFVIRQARSLGLKGHTRNLDDGSVEIVAEGEEAELRQLLALLKSGPSGARVDGVDAFWGQAQGDYHSFDILH
jgi:acylphosphatase